jgi:hypothetical protein
MINLTAQAMSHPASKEANVIQVSAGFFGGKI